MNTHWERITQGLSHTLSPGEYQVWIKPLTAKAQGQTLEITAPNDFVATWVRTRLLASIEEVAASVLGTRPSISVTARPATPRPEAGKADKPARAKAGSAERPALRLKKDEAEDPRETRLALPMVGKSAFGRSVSEFQMRFDDFVVGPCNDLAFAAARGVCRQGDSLDQLVLCSGPGLGKTHLIQAIGSSFVEQAGAAPRIRFASAEEFGNRLVLALKAREGEKFKAWFRDNVDVLLLEDIHFFQGKMRMQEELLNTLDSLRSRGCRIVLTSSFLPKEMVDLDEALRSRLSSGLLAFMHKPDLNVRKEILERKAAVHQVRLPDPVRDLLAGRLSSDVRQLESCLSSLILKARLLKCSLSEELAWDVLSNYKLEAPQYSLEQIVDYVCRAYSLKETQLTSKSRKRDHVLARNTAFFLARKYTELSLSSIGQRFNRRHSTVVKALTNVERHMNMKTPLGRQLETAITRLST